MPKYVYKNGNSVVTIDSNDGTKERFTEDNEFNLDFPETIDMNCTTFCDAGCPFCYAECSINGKHADLMSVKFIDTLKPYTEVALQVNDLTHPQLVDFLNKLKSKKIFANITVNQRHFEEKEDFIKNLVDKDLVKGIGISLVNPSEGFIKRVKKYPNAVIHTINGILKASDIEALRDNGLKILILGYKYKGRGKDYKDHNFESINAKQRYLYGVASTLPNHFKVVSFDNLALEQLNVKRFIHPRDWEEIYLGDEGTSSMYIDLVSGKYGVSSLCKENEMHPITSDIEEMFKVVKEDAKTYKL